MKKVICKKDKNVTIPVGLCENDEEIELSFKAGVPLNVPDAVADAHVRALPQIFSFPDVTDEVEEKPVADDEFDAVEFLINGDLSEEKLETLKAAELHAVVSALKIKNVPKNTGKKKLIARIVNFVTDGE